MDRQQRAIIFRSFVDFEFLTKPSVFYALVRRKLCILMCKNNFIKNVRYDLYFVFIPQIIRQVGRCHSGPMAREYCRVHYNVDNLDEV